MFLGPISNVSSLYPSGGLSPEHSFPRVNFEIPMRNIAQKEKLRTYSTNMDGQIPKSEAFPQNSVRTFKERELRSQESEIGKKEKNRYIKN